MKRNAIFAVLMVVLGVRVFGQSGAVETAGDAGGKETLVNSAELDKRGRKIVKKNVIKNPFFAPSKRDYEMIALAPEIVSQYQEFLKTPNTGLIRLHDQSKCTAARNVVNIEEPCPSNFVLGKATSYSFRAKKYRTLRFSDLTLNNRRFYTVGINSQGIIAALGNQPLENVTVAADAIKNLLEFVPSTDPAQAVQEGERFAKGVRAGKIVYQKQASALPDQTYAMRAIAYKSKVYQRRGAFKVNILDDDKRDDVVIAFRIVKAHDDGSFTVLWKELDRKPAPKLIFEKPSEKQNSKSDKRD